MEKENLLALSEVDNNSFKNRIKLVTPRKLNPVKLTSSNNFHFGFWLPLQILVPVRSIFDIRN